MPTPTLSRPGAALASLLLLALALPLPAAAAEAEAPRVITITGEGEAMAAPDLATITAGVVTEGDTAAEATAANSRAMAAAVARLKASGIADRDLQTSNFSIAPRYYQRPKSEEPPYIVGYTVTNQLTVVVRDLDILGRVLDAVVAEGINQVSGPSFGFEEPDKLQDVARARAAADALRKARLYAEALGLTLGPVMSVTESGGFTPRPLAKTARFAMAEAMDVPIEAGELGLRAQVTVVWRIE